MKNLKIFSKISNSKLTRTQKDKVRVRVGLDPKATQYESVIAEFNDYLSKISQIEDLINSKLSNFYNLDMKFDWKDSEGNLKRFEGKLIDLLFSKIENETDTPLNNSILINTGMNEISNYFIKNNMIPEIKFILDYLNRKNTDKYFIKLNNLVEIVGYKTMMSNKDVISLEKTKILTSKSYSNSKEVREKMQKRKR